MDYLDDLLKSLLTLGPEMLTCLAMIALGYLLRVVPSFPNKWIPMVCILGAPILYPLLISDGQIAPTVKNPIVLKVLIGFLLGVLSWFGHDKVLSKVEDRIPFLKGLLSRAESKASEQPKEP